MHRCGSGFFLTFVIILVSALTGCLGKSSTNAGNTGIETVSLSPGNFVSLNVGTSQFFSASAKNAAGGAVLGADIQFVVGVPPGTTGPAAISVNSAGNACAGNWDATGALCSPGAPGLATVTAVASGVSSAPTTVYVHQHVDSIQVTRLDPQGPPLHNCFSQGDKWNYAATVFSNNLDITNTVGPINWTFSNSGVVNVTPLTIGQPPNQVLNQLETTAKSPGITQLFATVSGTSSAPILYTSCLVQSVHLQIGAQAAAGSSITVNNGGSVPVTATVLDTVGAVVNTPPLTWSTTNPEVAGFTTTTSSSTSNNATARANLGGATLTASCSPPSCNIGVLPGAPVYASDGVLPNGTNGYGAISVDVTTTSKPPTYTAWAATTDCEDQLGCNSAIFAVTAGTNPIGSIVSLPRTPNSILFNHVASGRLYIGSDQGLMYVDVSTSNPSATLISGSSTPCNLALCGKVLAISNDGKLVVVADNVSTPSQVYIYNSTASGVPIDLIIPGQTATAAAFSPDQLKVFILTNTGNMYVYSTVDALSSVSIAPTATDAKFSADGSFAYVAGTPASSVSAFSTCSLPTNPSVDIGSVGASSMPLQLFPSPNVLADSQGLTQDIFALEPPNIEKLTAQYTQDPVTVDTQTTCNPPKILTFAASQSFNLGQGNFTPLYTQLVADGTEIILVAQKIPAVLLFSITNGTTSSIPLFGSADPLSASASTDGSQVFVAACDQYAPDGTTCSVGSIHIINTNSQGDIQQVPYLNNGSRNMCNNNGNPAPQCLPDLVAIRPQ